MRNLEQVIKRLIEFSLLTDEEITTIRNSLLNIEIHFSPKTNYIEFIEQFNQITGKKYKPDVESRELFYENESFYSLTDKITALKNALTDKFSKENPHIIKPSYILKSETIAKYINYEAYKGISSKNGENAKIENTNYHDNTL